MTYGLKKHQIEYAKQKVNLNKQFMINNGIQLDDKIIPYADFVANSYINSDRYIAELQHRAWSVFDYAKEQNLSNVFITLTLPSKWHSHRTLRSGKLVNNPKYAGRKYITKINGYSFYNAHIKQYIPFIEPIIDFSNTIDKYTPRNASKELSKMLKKIFDDRAYKGIEKDKRCYFRVTEPHKDGTPHIHMSLFVPANKVQNIVKSINRLFPAPASKLETEVQSPVSYLMKYVLKTLDDLREDNEKITNLTLWYLYHGISRFYTSRTFVPLEVYRKLNGMYSLIDLTKEYTNDDIQIYTCTTTKKLLYIENEFGVIYTKKPVNFFDKQDIETDAQYNKHLVIKEISNVEIIDRQAYYEPLSKKDMSHHEKMTINGTLHIVEHTKLKAPPKYTKKPYQMNNTMLLDYFNNLDIDKTDNNHYSYTHRLVCERGLIMGEWLKPSDIQESREVF